MSQALNFGNEDCASRDRLPPRAEFAFGEAEGLEKMFALRSFKASIGDCREDYVARNQMETKTRLAIAALLVRVAIIDSDMSEVRSKELHRILKSRFRLDDSSATQLIEDACAAERRAIDLYQFTRLLNETLDDKSRHQVVQMMWEMAYVEGRLNGFEVNVVWRTADLLGVTSRRRVEIRQQIAAERSVLASR